MNKDSFIEELKKIGIYVTKDQLEKLDIYYNMLYEWNKKINLTSITEKKEVYLKHFYDSITLVKIIDLNNIDSLCDVGTGAGFPGIVLKIIFPNLKVTLIDSLNKRILFLNEVISKLELKGIETIHARMEDYSKKNKEKFDCIVTRAVANLSLILEISIVSLKVKGSFIAMKANCDEEIKKSLNLVKNLDCRIEKTEKFLLPYENSTRTLIKITKEGQTDKKYPRDIDKIKKAL